MNSVYYVHISLISVGLEKSTDRYLHRRVFFKECHGKVQLKDKFILV